MKNPNRLIDLFNTKLKIEQEIEKIQKSCNHSKKSLKSIRERVDSSLTVIRWVCNKCSLIVGYPNNKDKNDFLK